MALISEAQQILRPPRRTPSSSSSESSFRTWSSSSFSHQFPPFSPSMKGKGIPFSWEQIPGIPKHQIPNSERSSSYLLPLPPAVNPKSAGKKGCRVRWDPFEAALLACSKEEEEEEHGRTFKVSRSLSDRFGLISMYSSCRRRCAVSESIVYIPRSTPEYVVNRPSSYK